MSEPLQTERTKEARASILEQVCVSKSTPRMYGGGKPQSAVTKKKTKTICLRLSDEELNRLRHKAKAAGISVSELLRDNVNKLRVYNHRQKQQWFATLLSVRKQLSVLADRAPGFAPVEEVVTAAYLAVIARQLQQMEAQEPDYARQDVP